MTTAPAAAGRRSPAPLVLLLGTLLLCACRPPQPAALREELLVFGSPATIELRSEDSEAARAAVLAVARRLSQREREWHPWRDSALTRLNAALAAGREAAVPESLLALISRSRELRAASDGLFDPAVGSLVAAWGFHTDSYPVTTPPPGDDFIARWRHSPPTLADLRVDSARVSGARRDLQLDFNAIAEGAACAEALQLIAAHGVEHALVTLGGDLCARGHARGRPWRAALRDAFGEATAILGVVDLHDGEALFSSGAYQKYREPQPGERWPHVLDPRTGMPARGVAATAVLARDPVLADAAATALLIAGPERFAELAQRMGLRCALLLTDDDRLLVTAPMQARIQWRRQPPALAAPLPLEGPC